MLLEISVLKKIWGYANFVIQFQYDNKLVETSLSGAQKLTLMIFRIVDKFA